MRGSARALEAASPASSGLTLQKTLMLPFSSCNKCSSADSLHCLVASCIGIGRQPARYPQRGTAVNVLVHTEMFHAGRFNKKIR